MQIKTLIAIPNRVGDLLLPKDTICTVLMYNVNEQPPLTVQTKDGNIWWLYESEVTIIIEER